ncbi:MAG: hypothetical protein RLZZ532_1770, partial [Cyanobacteriota bacterium]
LTPEQQAIAADIDNSKVLLEALGSNNSLISPLNPNIEINKDLFKQAQDTDKKSEPSPRSNPLLDSLFPPSNSTNQPPVEENSPKTSNFPNPVSENPPPSTTAGSNLGLKGPCNGNHKSRNGKDLPTTSHAELSANPGNRKHRFGCTL